MNSHYLRQLRHEAKPRLQPFFASRVKARAGIESRSRILRIYWIAVGLLSLAILGTAHWMVAAMAIVGAGGAALFGWRRLFRYLVPFLR